VFRRTIVAALFGASAAVLCVAAPSFAQSDNAPGAGAARRGALEQSSTATPVPMLSVVVGLAVLGSTLGAITTRRRAELVARRRVPTSTVVLTPHAERHPERSLAGSVSTFNQAS
jgi:hypothetical protein